MLRKRIHVSENFDGAKIRTVVNGKKVLTPMIVVFAAIALTDVMFAFDSIPAIFGITTDPFIVFTATFCPNGSSSALLLWEAFSTARVPEYGISFILAFIGFKLITHAMHENQLPFINGGEHIEWAPDISSNVSLAVIVASIAVSAVVSLISAKRKGVKAPAA